MKNHKVDLKINFSVAIPVYNEENNIINLLESLINQTYLPSEIIISDGGSNDNTVKLINEYITKNNNEKIFIKVIGREGKCRGSGRNIAIKNCKSNYIALIDSGHFADKNWLSEFASLISKKKEADVIFGSVNPIKKNFFDKIVSSFILGNKQHNEKIKETVASLIIKKNAFEKIGFFIESNDGSYVVEDLNFINKIKNTKGINKFYLESSFTNWKVSDNYKQLFNKYVNYSIGAINSGYFDVWHKSVFRNLFFLFLIIYFSIFFLNLTLLIIILIIVFLFRSILYLNKNQWFNKANIFIKIKYLISLSFLLLLIDFAAIKGFFLWLVKKIKFN